MKVTVVGTGYVGLVSGVCFADLGNDVVCVDKDASKIERLNRFESPIYEPGVEELIEKNVTAGRLTFTANLKQGISGTDVVIIAVGTPSLPNGEANLSYVDQVARDIAEAMSEYKIVVTKSTVPVGTNERIKAIIAENTDIPFDVVSVPEFLREGSAIHDTLNPDRVIIGADNEAAQQKIAELHRPLTEQIVLTDIRSAEMIKYASNAFLATKISFINEIANICDKVGADVTKVAVGMGLDNRIGSAFLNAGIGYGGSCFPKDTDALIQIAGNVDYNFKLLKSVVEVNKGQRFYVIDKVKKALGDISGKTIGVWGLAFKPNTDDVREAPAFEIIAELLKLGANVKAYDPVAMNNFRREAGDINVTWCEDALSTATDCDALCLLTEWNEFKTIDLPSLENVMKQPNLIDGRNVFTETQLEQTGINYFSVGRRDRKQTISDTIVQ